MRKLLAYGAVISLAVTSAADCANAGHRHRYHHRHGWNHYTISPHEGIPRYGRTGSTMPPTGTPAGHENAAPIGDTQMR